MVKTEGLWREVQVSNVFWPEIRAESRARLVAGAGFEPCDLWVMSAVSGSHNASQQTRRHTSVRVTSQVRRHSSFRPRSPLFADVRGNVCGHCADINDRAFQEA